MLWCHGHRHEIYSFQFNSSWCTWRHNTRLYDTQHNGTEHTFIRNVAFYCKADCLLLCLVNALYLRLLLSYIDVVMVVVVVDDDVVVHLETNELLGVIVT